MPLVLRSNQEAVGRGVRSERGWIVKLEKIYILKDSEA